MKDLPMLLSVTQINENFFIPKITLCENSSFWANFVQTLVSNQLFEPYKVFSQQLPAVLFLTTFSAKFQDVGDRAFTWSDQTPVDYQNWAPGEPNNYLDSEGIFPTWQKLYCF